MTNIIHGLTQNGIPRSLLSTTRAAGAVYQADANGDIAGHSLPTLEVARNADYDQYSLYNQLYYGGQISDIDVSGLRGLAFDGFVDSKFVDAGNALTIDTVNKKALHSDSFPNAVANTNPAAMSSPNKCVTQRFLATFGGTVTGVTVRGKDAGYGGQNIRAELWTADDAWNPIAKLADSNKLNFAGDDLAKDYALTFAPTVTLSKGVRYLFKFINDSVYAYLFTSTVAWGNGSINGAGGAVSDVYLTFNAGSSCYGGDSFLIPKPKTLGFNPSNLTMYVSHLGSSIVKPQVSLNGGAFADFTLVSSRTDPKFATYTEDKWRFTCPAGVNIVAPRIGLSTAGITRPELKRYGLLFA